MKRRIFTGISTVALASLLLLCTCVVLLVYRTTTQNGFDNLRADAIYISAGIDEAGEDYLHSIASYPGRITWIAPDGTVLYDNVENEREMDNHAERPEVAAALQNGYGSAQRNSSTLGSKTLYYALRLEDGSVLRLSVQVGSLWAQAAQLIPWLAAVSCLLVAAAAFFARWHTRRIVEPINQLNLDAPFDADAYDELSPLLRKIALQKNQIEKAAKELERRQEEFTAITQSMSEGLIVVDAMGRALVVNQSARQILGLGSLPKTPALLLELNRSLALEQAVEAATAGQRTERELELAGRLYRLVASPTGHAAGVRGAVLLLMDDTERLQAEQTRREFSANVSHELKTPLTSISGYAEIIRDGLVKPGDVAGFAGKIYDESARMIALVNDIIGLSFLDEKQTQSPRERANLLMLARETAAMLEKQAAGKGIALAVEGDDTVISCVPSIISEILFNLVDNGIAYTGAGGSVVLAVGKRENEAYIRASDTGIGIAPQHQAHVFERFYRVDKSHSRHSGGTGLGLSIVKRGALFHGGRVELASQLGKGSTFTVWLPLDEAEKPGRP